MSTFTGGITNSGTITPSGVGILVSTASTFTGGITNSGTIATTVLAGISVEDVRTFVGGITNGGTLSGAGTSGAIVVKTVSSFSGGITNTGHLTFTGSGSSVAAIAVVGVSVFSGGISNAGTISAANGAGIRVGITISGTPVPASTFVGGITNTGTITAQTGIVVVGGVTFGGGISNSGTISASGPGIQIGKIGIGLSGTNIIIPVTSFTGGITNSGTLSGNVGILVVAASTFGGGISNAGTISSGEGAGIKIGVVTGAGAVASVATFSGGITNSGAIQASGIGIDVLGVTSFSNGIGNSGTITATTGISVRTVADFSGGITNSGTMVVGHIGILVGVSPGERVSRFAGGITNSGIITADGANGKGIQVDVSTFAGGVTNSGSISAASFGMHVINADSFAGGVVNSGTINSGNGGILVSNSIRVAGGILNTGTITSAASGIGVAFVDNFTGGITNTGKISAGGTTDGVVVFEVTTFAGGIINSGTLSGGVGIRVSGGASFSGAIVNSGNITGTTAAIDVSAAPNAMTINQMAGTITGAIRLSPFADALNISGGTINGNIVGQGASNTVNFALGSGAFTYGSAFSITGIHQLNVNSGLVILNGTNSAANIAVNGGTLEVGDASHTGATLTGAFTIASGGTLEGHGTVIGDFTVPAGATLAPGGSIGTLNVTGNLSLAAGSFYQVTVNAAGLNSKTVATGTATISGGTVVVQEQPGNYPSSIRYTILTANTGVTGTFAGAVSQTAFFTPTLTYDANDAFLTLTRNLTFFSSVALTSNQHGVGAALDASAGGSALVQAVAFAPSATMQQTLDRLSGEIHGSVQSVLVGDSLYMRQAMLGRLRQASYAGAPGLMAALGFAGPDAVSVAGEAPTLAYAAVPYAVKAPPAAPSRGGSDVTYWMQGLGAWGRIDGDGNASMVRNNLAGFLTGFDARFGDWGRAGIAGGYTHASVNVDAAASSAAIDTAHLGVYAGTSLGAFNLRSGAAYAWHTIDTTRTIAFSGFFDQATGRYNGGTGQVFGEVGYSLPFGRIAAEPFAGLAYVRVDTSGFNETGGAAALAGGNNADNVLYSSLGLRIATSYMLQNGMALVPRFSAAWQHAFGDVTPSAALAFQSTGTAFTTSGVPLARDAALVEAGFDLRVTPQMKLGASYTGEIAGHLQDHAVKGTFTWNF